MDLIIQESLPLVIGLGLGTGVIYVGVSRIYIPLLSALVVAFGGFVMVYSLSHFIGFESKIGNYFKVVFWIVFVIIFPLMQFQLKKTRHF